MNNMQSALKALKDRDPLLDTSLDNKLAWHDFFHSLAHTKSYGDANKEWKAVGTTLKEEEIVGIYEAVLLDYRALYEDGKLSVAGIKQSDDDAKEYKKETGIEQVDYPLTLEELTQSVAIRYNSSSESQSLIDPNYVAEKPLADRVIRHHMVRAQIMKQQLDDAGVDFIRIIIEKDIDALNNIDPKLFDVSSHEVIAQIKKIDNENTPSVCQPKTWAERISNRASTSSILQL